jgi:hypothetical protein
MIDHAEHFITLLSKARPGLPHGCPVNGIAKHSNVMFETFYFPQGLDGTGLYI